MTNQVKVLVVEDHPIVSDGCQLILSRRNDIVAMNASSASQGVALNREFIPNVILLDLGLPDASGFDIIQELTDDNPAVKVVIFSMYEAPSFVTLALEKGAKGYITKDDDPNAILVAIDRVISGSIFLGHTVAQTLAITNAMPINDPLHDLNDRERQIVKLLGEGTSLTEISVRLALGYKTVANTVTIIKQKLGVPSTPRLIKFAVEIRSGGRGGGAITY